MQSYNKVVLETSKINNGVLKLSEDQAAKLNLSNKTITLLHAGKNHVQIIISINDSSQNKNVFCLSSGTLKRLRLSSAQPFGVSRQKDGIHLGPVVGIMANLYKERDRPFGPQSLFIKQLIQTAMQIGELCYGFSPHDIHWDNKTITGYTLGKNGWVKRLFPLPDVVYPRRSGCSAFNRQVRKKLQCTGCTFLNPPLIGKWQSYKILAAHPILKNYLPDTNLVSDFNRVDQMINKYRIVYMKPVAGSQGRNIIKIALKDRPNRYHYQYQMNNQMYNGTSANMSGLRRSLRRVMGNQTYIVQNQINLLRSEGNILDVRVLVQKDDTGNFTVTGKACRVGKPGSITSNISAGGHGSKLNLVLARNFSEPKQRQSIIDEIDMVACEAAKVLEASASGPIGELGIDIGIDRSGKIWFIEANLRPARKLFSMIGESEVRMNSIIKPLLYCRYAAGFTEL